MAISHDRGFPVAFDLPVVVDLPVAFAGLPSIRPGTGQTIDSTFHSGGDSPATDRDTLCPTRVFAGLWAELLV